MRPRKRRVRGGPMRRFFVALRAVVYMTCFVLFWGWIALSAREFDRSFGVLLPAWTETLGIIFMPVGGLLALTCAAVFIARGRGTPAPFDPPEEFVAAGPYKYVRNPMYIGALVLLIGFRSEERRVGKACRCSWSASIERKRVHIRTDYT